MNPLREILIFIISKIDFFQLERPVSALTENGLYSLKGIEDGKFFGNEIWDEQTGDDTVIAPEEFDLDTLLYFYDKGVKDMLSVLTPQQKQKIQFLNQILYSE